MTCTVPIASLYERLGADTGTNAFVARHFALTGMAGHVRNRGEHGQGVSGSRGCGGQRS